MGCCGDLLSGLSRYILFLFNFIIFVCSIIFIVYGVLLLNDENAGLDDFDNLSVGQLAIALGVLIALVSFFGCCGAIKQNSCLLTTYAIILLTLFIIQVVLAILAFISIRNGDGQFEDKVKDFITKLFDKAKNDNDAEAIKVVDNMQQDWECCGVDSYTYWGLLNIPDSCCSGDGGCTIATVYQQGCAEAFKENLEYNITVIGAVAAVFAIIELVGAVFAFCVKTRK